MRNNEIGNLVMEVPDIDDAIDHELYPNWKPIAYGNTSPETMYPVVFAMQLDLGNDVVKTMFIVADSTDLSFIDINDGRTFSDINDAFAYAEELAADPEWQKSLGKLLVVRNEPEEGSEDE